MKEKIKNFFAFLKSAWVSGPKGKWGIVLLVAAIFLFVNLFRGSHSIQSFIINAWRLNHANAELVVAKKELKQIQHHIYLLQHPNGSNDYIEELGLKTLNIGDAGFHELKY